MYESEARLADVQVVDFSLDGVPDLIAVEAGDFTLVSLEQAP